MWWIAGGGQPDCRRISLRPCPNVGRLTVDDQEYKLQVEAKHKQRIERLAREAQDKAALAAAEKAAALVIAPPVEDNSAQLRDWQNRRVLAERARRGETEPVVEPVAKAESAPRNEAA